jgi:hypothetical protein
MNPLRHHYRRQFNRLLSIQHFVVDTIKFGYALDALQLIHSIDTFRHQQATHVVKPSWPTGHFFRFSNDPWNVVPCAFALDWW